MNARDKQTIREEGVLRNVMELHPTHLTEPGLLRTHGVDPEGDPDEVEPWRRAIRELRQYGLLQAGDPIAPTIAAVRFAELVEL
jgi:hypothetical protein